MSKSVHTSASADSLAGIVMDSAGDSGLEKLRGHFSQQLSEIEILESMYSSSEFYLHNPDAKAQLEDFCMDKSVVVPPEVSYDIRLQCDGAADQPRHEVVATVTYPLDYPSKAPTVYVRLLNHYHTRQHQTYLNKTLTLWIKNLSKGDPCVLQIFSWIEQNTCAYVSSIRPQQLSSVESDTENQPSEVEFERLWIQSHHIYSREKREIAIALAKNLELTGFMLIGKPAAICVEGSRQDTRAFWEQIRRLTWQKISLKHQENFQVTAETLTQHQKFAKFTEMTAAGPGKPGNRENKDMGEVIRFLREHNCDIVIPLLFGINPAAAN